MKKKEVKNNVKKKAVSSLRKELNSANGKIKELEIHRNKLLREIQIKDDRLEYDYHKIKCLHDVNELKNKAIDGFYTIIFSLQQAAERANKFEEVMKRRSSERRTRDLSNKITGNCCDRDSDLCI